MTDSTDSKDQVDASRQDALRDMLKLFTEWEESCDVVDEAKTKRERAADLYDAAKGLALIRCNDQHYIGLVIIESFVVRVYEGSISVERAETL